MPSIKFAILVFAAVFPLSCPFAFGEDMARGAVSFSREIAPLLNRRCAACHCEDSAKGKYRLDTFARMLKPGDSEEKPIVSGKPEDSELYTLLVEKDPHDRMPQKADALPASEIALVQRWIKEGAKYDGGSIEKPLVELARHTMLKPAPKTYSRPMPIGALAFSPDGRQLTVGSYYELTFWDADDTSLVRRIGGLPEKTAGIAWSCAAGLIAVAGGSPNQWGTVALVEPKGNAEPRFLCDLQEMALAVAFSPDGAHIAAGCGDRTVRIFETASGKQTKILRHHADWVQSVAYSKDGKRIVSASRDRTVRVFDAETGEIETTYAGHDTPVISAGFSSSGGVVFSIAHENSIHNWDAFTGKPKPLIKVSKDLQALSMAGDHIIAATSDNIVHVIQTSDRLPLFALDGQRDVVGAIALSRSGELFATGGEDGEVCVWSLACGTWIRRFIASP